MSITVIQAPLAVMPIGNEIPLKLQTDNRYSSAGSGASVTLTFSDIETIAGRTFTLSYGDVSLQFYLAIAPDESGNQIRCASVGMPVEYWITWFAEDLMRNYYLQRDFTSAVDAGAGTIILTAKETGTAYNATLSFNNITGLDLTKTDGTDPVARENFELLCITEVEDGTTWRKLSEDRLTPDPAEQATFYLQDLMVPELTAEFTWPEVAGEYKALRPNHIKRYRLSNAELYDDSPRRLSLPAIYRAILGGFDYKMIAGLNGSTWGFLDYIISYKSFLTWQPRTKTINRTQPEKLYFINYNNVGSLELHIDVTFTDGTSSGSQELVTINPTSQYQVYELMVGYSQIDFTKISAKTVKSYQIWLEDNAGNAQSERVTYVLDTKNYRHERIFLFKNSFEAFETFRATGRKTHQNEIERMMLEKNDKDINLAQVYLAFEQQTFTINSGWISRETKDWLRELFFSRKVYEILNGYKFPIVITNEKNELFDDDTYLFDVKLEYKYNFKDKYFSGEPAIRALLAETGDILQSEDGQSLIG